jgi:hypothetical protein
MKTQMHCLYLDIRQSGRICRLITGTDSLRLPQAFNQDSCARPFEPFANFVLGDFVICKIRESVYPLSTFLCLGLY